jgi:leader peptidase (prepilin peptidase)/N-methyltransferase
MNGTRLRRAGKKTGLTGGEIDLALARRGTALRRELITSAAFAAIACSIVIASLFAAPDTSGLLGGALGLLMLAVAVADARAFIIPDNLTIAAFLLALTNAAIEGLASMPENIAVAALRGLVLALAFFALQEIYLRLRHRHGIGLGDVKLAAVAGAWLDWTLIPVAIEIAALTALIVYIANQLVLHRPLCAAAKLPFGLFFAPAIWVCWLLNAMFLES